MSENFFINTVAEELNIDPRKASAAAELLDQGATVPFIARYRKEATGSLDEVAITAVRDRLRQIRELASRKETVLGSLEKNGHLTDELQQKIENATTLAEVEDIYLPYRPRRRTRAVKAREKGLEPLAGKIFAQEGIDVHAEAEKYADPEKGVSSAEQALAGARDIIAETINESKEARARLRQLFSEKAVLKSRVIPGMEEKGAVFKDYFDWQEPAASVPSHRMLAVRRGEDQGIVSMSIQPDAQEAVGILEELFVKGSGEDSGQVKTAARDAYKRLLSGAMETEARLNAKQKADQEAIGIFAQNLRQVLLSPPLGAKRIMAVDPGYRTGCKIACLDRQGKLLHHETIYPHTGSREEEKAQQKVKSMCDEFSAEAVAVGNGTAGRETEAFIKKINFGRKIPVVMVDESGASVYSASEAARREFADLDLTVRGAVSIGRRLMDPLAELVKIDPKSIGVGEYQHDVD
ncbi:MAG: Tex-like N-terminal domain-containing protein, partial [Desulfosalsimonas sp.]